MIWELLCFARVVLPAFNVNTRPSNMHNRTNRLLSGCASMLLLLASPAALQAEPKADGKGAPATVAPKSSPAPRARPSDRVQPSGQSAARARPERVDRGTNSARRNSANDGGGGGRRVERSVVRPNRAEQTRPVVRADRVQRADRGERRERGGRGERRGRRYVWGDGYEFFFYDGYYHGNCAWLRERYQETGDSYWRRRYRLCRALD